MARIRSIHPDACVSETLAGISANLERTFVRLWTHCDDKGRCKDNPRLIAAAIYPLHADMTPEAVDAELSELAEAGLVIRYKADGGAFLQVRSWDEYQRPNRSSGSKFPSPPVHCAITEQSVNPHVPFTLGGDIGEGEGEGEGEGGEGSTRDEPLTEDQSNDDEPPAGGPSDFDAFWLAYPRKVRKPKALQAFTQALHRASADTITSGARRWGEYWLESGTDRGSVPYPTTFLNGDQWNDPCPPIARPEPRGFASIRRALGAAPPLELGGSA